MHVQDIKEEKNIVFYHRNEDIYTLSCRFRSGILYIMEELDDKVEPVATNLYWAVKHCQGNSLTPRTMVDNIVDYYQNNRKRSRSSSR